ncbi:unnamed protein product, partial [Brenthis ino]
MSVSSSSHTKSVPETVDTESTEEPLIQDRWTNNISYRQLVMSSCISIVQFWWHPYVHDFRRLVPFLFLYNVFSVFFAYPSFYLELALGVVTKKGVLNCWDLAPVARGVGISMLLTCMFTVLSLGAVSAWCLALVVHSIHSFLPWLHCAASAHPPCAARHRPLPTGSETPAQSFFFAVGVIRLKGSSRMFHECDWSLLLDGFQIWREAVEYSFLQMALSQGTLVMLGSYCPKGKHTLENTSVFAFAVSKLSYTVSALTLGACHGALYKDYDNSTNIWKGPTSSMILWADYVSRMPGSQFWSAIVFFTLFVLSTSYTALLVQTIMSTFTGRSIRKITWAFLILVCVLFCLIGIITLCTQGGMYILNFLMTWPVSKPRIPIAAAITIIITYLYGQTTFCEDVFFAVGEYPSVFLRICWAFTPITLVVHFITSTASSQTDTVAGWVLVMVTLLPMAIYSSFYLIFKFRVRNIVGNEK